MINERYEVTSLSVFVVGLCSFQYFAEVEASFESPLRVAIKSGVEPS